MNKNVKTKKQPVCKLTNRLQRIVYHGQTVNKMIR